MCATDKRLIGNMLPKALVDRLGLEMENEQQINVVTI